MKKIFAFLNFFMILCNTPGPSQSLGFVQSECGIIENPSYYFENFYSTHGGGYRLYHSGKEIAYDFEEFGGKSGQELRFIDDTTGFFIVSNAGPNYTIYKIINDSVIYTGLSPGDYYDLFIVSRHTVYSVSTINEGFLWLYIYQLSDLIPEPGKEIVFDSTMTSDTTVFDTVKGIPLCPNLQELNYRYCKAGDTLTYTIKFSVDTLSYIASKKSPEFKVFPNPTVDFIWIKPPQNVNLYSIKVLDSLGKLRKSSKMNDPAEKTIYIGDLDKGFYFIIIDDGKTKWVNKLIKI